MIPVLLIGQRVAFLLLRLGAAFVFMAHGLPKIKNLKVTAENFSAMGFRPGKFWGTSIGLLEVFGSIALIAGLFTQIFALLFAIEMVVAGLWKMRHKQKLVNGYELDFILFFVMLVLATSTNAPFSLDWYFQIYLF